MKKLLFLLVVIFSMVFNIQDTTAQQRPEDIAKIKTAELSQSLELSGEQQRALFRVFVKKEAAYAKQVTGKDLNNASVAAAKKDIDASFEKELKTVLTPEQYKKYKDSVE